MFYAFLGIFKAFLKILHKIWKNLIFLPEISYFMTYHSKTNIKVWKFKNKLFRPNFHPFWTPVNFLKLMKPDLYNCFESSFWTVWWCSFLVYMPFSWRNSFVNIWYLVGVNMNELVDKPLNKEFSSLFVPFTSTSSSTSTKTTKKKKQLKRKVNLISIQKSERLNEIRIQEFFKHFFQHIADLKRLNNCFKCVKQRSSKSLEKKSYVKQEKYTIQIYFQMIIYSPRLSVDAFKRIFHWMIPIVV